MLLLLFFRLFFWYYWIFIDGGFGFIFKFQIISQEAPEIIVRKEGRKEGRKNEYHYRDIPSAPFIRNMPIVQEVVSRMSFQLDIETDMPAIEHSVIKNRFEQEGGKVTNISSCLQDLSLIHI